MNSSPPQYLIRLDDFCPTMLLEPRDRFLSIFARHGVSPILAVVPDNLDPDLNRQSPDPKFWERMRLLQAAGATIAMHGYRHLCASRGGSLLRLHRQTEFAGVESSIQQQWVRSGLALLRGQGLRPRLFVAPRHGFDRNTLSALAAEGLGVLSDGFARRPFTQHEILWIPQQLWEPVAQKTGLWTICLHTNTASTGLEERLERFLAKHTGHLTSFDQVVAGYLPNPLRWNEQIGADLAHLRARISSARSRPARNS
jgi:hypothetical protein